MRVVRSARANADLEAIGDWIAQDNPIRAGSYVEELRVACREIGDHPSLYPLVPGRRKLRKRLVYPYLILYEVREDEVFIVSIRHGRRRRLR